MDVQVSRQAFEVSKLMAARIINEQMLHNAKAKDHVKQQQLIQKYKGNIQTLLQSKLNNILVNKEQIAKPKILSSKSGANLVKKAKLVPMLSITEQINEESMEETGRDCYNLLGQTTEKNNNPPISLSFIQSPIAEPKLIVIDHDKIEK